MARGEVRHERRAAKRHGFAVGQHTVDGVDFTTRLHCLERRDVVGQRHHLRAGELLDHRVAFLMIAVRVAAGRPWSAFRRSRSRGRRS